MISLIQLRKLAFFWYLCTYCEKQLITSTKGAAPAAPNNDSNFDTRFESLFLCQKACEALLHVA